MEFLKLWYRITLKYYSYSTYESLLAKELSSLCRILKWKPKWANFPVLNLYKCKPKKPSKTNSILYFKMSLLNVHIYFCVFVVLSDPFPLLEWEYFLIAKWCFWCRADRILTCRKYKFINLPLTEQLFNQAQVFI